MTNKVIILKLNVIVLGVAGTIDLIRGYMHTFNVRYAATEIAGIEPIADSLVLMVAFGISNFLTGFFYFLIIRKASQLAPTALLLISISYFLGSVAMRYQHITLESPFVGRYMMMVYLSVCFLVSVTYFLMPSGKQTNAIAS